MCWIKHHVVDPAPLQTSLMYRKKFRLQKVRLLDGKVKTVELDEILSVATICKRFFQGKETFYAEQFSLKLDGSGPRAFDLEVQVVVVCCKTRKTVTHTHDWLTGEWLIASQSLHDNGVKPDQVVTLQQKFFVSDVAIPSDPLALQTLFTQVRSPM